MTAILLAAVLCGPQPGRAVARPEAGREAALRIVPRPPPRSLSKATVAFDELFAFGERAPEPTPRLLALQGARVTLVGFMVRLDAPVKGGFYLSPYPASSDESGAGRGDVPPTSILVRPAAAAGREVAFIPGALEVTGTLDVGNRESDGERTTVRLTVRQTRQIRFARTRLTARAAFTKQLAGRESR